MQSERKTEYYESLLAEQKRIEAEMANIDDETRRQVDEHRALERDVNNYIASASEPTTPPEYQDTFPTAISRPNRYSSASMTSPPGFAVRPNRAGSQLTSPPSNLIRPYTANNATSHLPSKSVPGSRRNSDEESDDEDDFMYAYANNNTFHRSGAKYVRPLSFCSLCSFLMVASSLRLRSLPLQQAERFSSPRSHD